MFRETIVGKYFYCDDVDVDVDVDDDTLPLLLFLTGEGCSREKEVRHGCSMRMDQLMHGAMVPEVKIDILCGDKCKPTRTKGCLSSYTRATLW
jgi:hypothetical protein